MSEAIQEEQRVAAALPEGKGAASIAALVASLASVFEQGIQRHSQAAALMAELERQLAGGAGVQYVAELMPGQSLKLRCFLVPSSDEDDPVLLFEVEAGGHVASRLLN